MVKSLVQKAKVDGLPLKSIKFFNWGQLFSPVFVMHRFCCFLASLVVTTSAIDCLERLVSEVTFGL